MSISKVILNDKSKSISIQPQELMCWATVDELKLLGRYWANRVATVVKAWHDGNPAGGMAPVVPPQAYERLAILATVLGDEWVTQMAENAKLDPSLLSLWQQLASQIRIGVINNRPCVKVPSMTTLEDYNGL